MTDKMTKEEARAVLKKFLSRNQLAPVTDVKAYVLKIVESIEPERKKVVLPKKVGEQWDKLVCSEKDSDFATKVDDALYDLSHNVHNDGLDILSLRNWWSITPGSCSALIDASKYGWVAKPDKLYRVKVYGLDLPALFYRKRDDGTLSFVQGGAGLRETEFTMDEIKQRHLENCEREEVKGHAVKNDKKYNVKVSKKWSGDDKHYWTKEQDGTLTWACLINKDYMIPAQQFTEAEIDHYGLQDCEKVEVTDDEQ